MTLHTTDIARRLACGLAACAMVGTAGAVAAGGSALAAETELPVYAVRASGLDEEQAAKLGQVFGVEVAREKDGSVRFADEKGFLAVPTIDAGQGGKDEDGNATTVSLLDVAALGRIKPIDPKEALKRVTGTLSEAGLYPEGGAASAGNTTFEAVDGRGRQTVSAALDTTVSFSFTLAGLPYEGPGSKVRVAFDGAGAVSQLSYSTRALEPKGSVPVLDLAAGRQRCEKAMAGAVTVKQPEYAYYAPALSTALDRVEPSFRCAGVSRDGTPAQVVFVPAAVDASLPELPAPPPPRGGGPQMSTFAYGVADVGSEGTGPCSGLPHTGTNLASFNNRFTSSGYPVEFSWLDQNAWEDDFKDPAYSGHDGDWTDHVDMTYWQGHGSPTGFSFSGCSSVDDTFLSNTEARWGNGDVEWMSLFTCLVLDDGAAGQRWWQRWGNAFHGLHQINSFDTVSYHSSSHGGTYANYMLRTPFLWWNNPMSVRAAWAQASIDDQPSSVVWATMGPIGPGGLVNLNDYFWGKGSVGPDVSAAQRTGWWYISGTS
ncbi:DUF6345 domain-containing protein [Plantactinospora sp. WMMB334]|uniref:DUF6345 domain-containing protein n=1 Tax=Plantactinospora sp. WMMB334 TaxID=3404119 RepID=UPI003B95F1F4